MYDTFLDVKRQPLKRRWRPGPRFGPRAGVIAAALALVGCASPGGGRAAARDREAYVEGLRAYRLGDAATAEASFEAAAAGTDPDAACRARAALGLMFLEQDRPAEAAPLLAAAAGGLSGTDAERAAWFASVARRRAGTDGNEGFTLQVGAFRERPRAEKAAKSARRHGVSPVRITPRADERGRTMFLVQLGRYDTRAAAAEARQRLGELGYIVAALR